ncbi:MAG: hypothetical protein RL033_6277 [Pseudomonadota bacterium]|jgi:hypothetical protein
MSNENEQETDGEELFIEELAEVRGGLIGVTGKYTTLALGEEGTAVPHIPVIRKPLWDLTKPPPRMSTMALGEEGTSAPHFLPMSDE